MPAIFRLLKRRELERIAIGNDPRINAAVRDSLPSLLRNGTYERPKYLLPDNKKLGDAELRYLKDNKNMQ